MLALSPVRSWPPGRRFWILHLWVPLLFFLVLAWTFEHSALDLWFADAWYALEGDHWALRHHWFTTTVMHHYGKVGVITFGAVIIGLTITSFWANRLKPLRRSLIYLVIGLVLVPALISWSKQFNDVPCPYDMLRYGGELSYRHTFEHEFSAVPLGARSCFPAGHAAGGYALLVIYFAAWPWVRRPGWFLLPGLLVGAAFGLAQQARGAHFVSHDLWTLALTWFAALGLFALIRPVRGASKGLAH
jgi:membrane-associated PAP2 superfamily phosphatase